MRASRWDQRSAGLTRLGLVALLFSLGGCAGGAGNSEAPPIKAAPSLQPGGDTGAAAEGGAGAMAKAPDEYRVKFTTTKGDFVVLVHRDWAPFGADRFHELVQAGLYDDVKFFRVIKDFMVQFGIHGDPNVSAQWRDRKIPDDPVTKSNKRGYITFATSGPDSRTSQVFVNYVDNPRLDGMGFAPFGEVVEGMDVVDALNGEYDGEPSNYQPQIQQQGNPFLEQAFPNLDSVKTARIVTEEPTPAAAPKE